MMTLKEVSSGEQASPTLTRTRSQNLDPNMTKPAGERRVGEEHDEVNGPKDVGRRSMHGTCRRTRHGAVSVVGRRREMEDTVRVVLEVVDVNSKKYDFFGVFDGHGGSSVADTCRERMHKMVVEEVDAWKKSDGCGSDDVVNWKNVLLKCFARMDKEVGGVCENSDGDGCACVGRSRVRGDVDGGAGGDADDVEEMTVGSTAVMALVGKQEIVIANCGDSRAIISRNGVAMPLSVDHKPNRPDELARIEAAGGRVINWNGHRVFGVLATSRSIGDHYLKPFVSSIPEVTINERREDDEFIILASDGLWDVVTNEVAVQFVRRCLFGKGYRKLPGFPVEFAKYTRVQLAAAMLVELAMTKGSRDNISVIVVDLGKFRQQRSQSINTVLST